MDIKTQETVLRSIHLIDDVVNKISLPLSERTDNKIILTFGKILSKREDEFIEHCSDKFISHYDKDFGQYFLNADLYVIRAFFEYYSIPLEEEKYSDELERIKAQISGKDNFEIYVWRSKFWSRVLTRAYPIFISDYID